MMEPEFNLGTVSERVVLTPAERAVLVEQAEAAKVALEQFQRQAREGTAGDTIRAFIPAIRAMEYGQNILNHKIAQVIVEDHERGKGH